MSNSGMKATVSKRGWSTKQTEKSETHLDMRVLLVEDDPILQFDIEEIVGSLGHTVVGPFSKLDKAMSACETSKPDAAIIDFNLGNGQTSFELAQLLEVSNVPYAISTGYGRHHIPDILTKGQIIEKPYSERDIEEFLKEVLF